MTAMASLVTFPVLPYLVSNSGYRPRSRVQAESSLGDKSMVSSSPESVVEERVKIGHVTGGNGYAVSKIEVMERKKVEKEARVTTVLESLQALWDDGYGTKSVKDYLDCSRDMIRPDGGPPRWFCPVECGQPLNDSPVLLFLPGLDGTGLGLILHHKALGRAFEVRCLHIPVYDRSPFEDLVKFVEKTVKAEYASSPNKPVYLVGDSFGGCLALAVAALNPTIDLVLLLANPATSFGRSQLQPLLPLLEAMPDEIHFMVPYFLSFVVGDPVKMATVNVDNVLPPRLSLEQLSVNLASLLPRLSGLADILPKETLLWKLKLLKSAASYTNSRLHAINAEVLLLVSGKDNMLPSRDEAQRLMNSLKNCRVRYFKDNGHALLLEDGVNLLTIIKGTNIYRRHRTRMHDYILDFLPPSMSEYKVLFNQVVGLFLYASSSVLFSTLDDGKIVRGLAGVPSEGPVLLVGYHMLMGAEMFSLAEEFLREKNIMVRGLAHSELFSAKTENPASEFSLTDWLKVTGALPVTASNLFKLFSTKSHVLLYPGGAREAFHCKGEEYKLFWPEQPEFVRMAARFGATIVPFGAVGEDDMMDLVLDHNDLMRIPFVNDNIRETSAVRVREGLGGEVANEAHSIPVISPRIPGRLYLLFGKPIETRGRYEILKDRANAKELYLQVKFEVESCIAYLLKKREEDPCRSIFDRTIHRVLHSPRQEIPAFDPE